MPSFGNWTATTTPPAPSATDGGVPPLPLSRILPFGFEPDAESENDLPLVVIVSDPEVSYWTPPCSTVFFDDSPSLNRTAVCSLK